MSQQIIWVRNGTTNDAIFSLHTELRKVAEQAPNFGVVRRLNIHIFTLLTIHNISYDLRMHYKSYIFKYISTRMTFYDD